MGSRVSVSGFLVPQVDQVQDQDIHSQVSPFTTLNGFCYCVDRGPSDLGPVVEGSSIDKSVVIEMLVFFVSEKLSGLPTQGDQLKIPLINLKF